MSPIGDNILSPDDVFYGDSEQPWEVTEHFEGEINQDEVFAKAILEGNYGIRTKATKGKAHIEGDLAYTFFKMFQSLNKATAIGLDLNEVNEITLEAESEYGRLFHKLSGDEAQQIYDDAAEEVPAEARGFQNEQDTTEEVVEVGKKLIESQAMNYFKRYQQDVKYAEKER